MRAIVKGGKKPLKQRWVVGYSLMKAFKLINTPNKLSAFESGSIPELECIDATHFFAQTTTNAQFSLHPAPRYQFVITIKGKLKFTVSNGESFFIEPGIILVAKDTEGEGHKWEIVDGTEWHRIYIVPHTNAEDHFIADHSAEKSLSK